MTTELAPGVVIGGRYRLEYALGQGGMGVVWAATHAVTRKRVALKFVRGPAHLRSELRRRFLREARAASTVVHPNVLPVHDVFELDDETPVMLMDLLEGETLGQRIAREKKLSLAETADILIQVVSGVGTAHATGVVHRDLKPDNVFLVPASGGAPSVRILDFGIAKLVGMEGSSGETSGITGTGSMLGTPCYMSPEQSFGEKHIDQRTDVWSLGAILYECLTGARPVEGDTVGQVVKRLLSDGITPIAALAPTLPNDVTDLVDRMLGHHRDQRPSDLRDVMPVLARYTGLRPPDFGAPVVERTFSDLSESLTPAHLRGAPATPTPAMSPNREGPDGTASSTPDAQVSVRGPETAGAQTLSSRFTSRRSARNAGFVGLAIVLGLAAFFLSRTRTVGSPAVASASLSVTASPPPAASAKAVASLPQNAVPEPEPKPASTTPEPSASNHASKPLAHAAAPHHGEPAHVAPARSSAPAPAAVTAPSPVQPPPGGLAQKPPF